MFIDGVKGAAIEFADARNPGTKETASFRVVTGTSRLSESRTRDTC